MCGIAGFVGSIFSEKQLKEHIQSACHALRHRGPDEQGYSVSPNIALGASRLAIRDIQGGSQPMTHQDITLVFNGELYETDTLKKRLIQGGHQFKTECDTEILLNAYIEFGPSIFAQLSGMFAFAIWDAKNKKLCLGRDRWGEKPLYYTFGDGFLAFASEIKALKVWPGLLWDISLEDMHLFVKNSYLPGPRTGWKGVFKLTQGSFLTWQNNSIQHTRFFSPELKEENDLITTPENLYQLLSSSVKECAVSDRPVGVFLSGGIDSTTITYLLSRHLGKIPAFSLDWEDHIYSEKQYMQKVAESLDIDHFAIKCDPDFFMTHFDAIVKMYDEPFGDESMVPTYCLAKFAKQQVDVVLTGDGADEFFHGYERYFFNGNFETYQNLFAATRSDVQKSIWAREFIKSPTDEKTPTYSLDADNPRLRSWVDINTYLTDDILMKVDRACMACSLEPRAPFLTAKVTNFALNCKIEQLIGGGQRGKEILREAMKNSIPNSILERKKMGFGVPLNSWFRSSLKQWMISRLTGGTLLKTGWFSEEGIKKLITGHISNLENHSRTILNLLVLESWLRSFRGNG